MSFVEPQEELHAAGLVEAGNVTDPHKMNLKSGIRPSSNVACMGAMDPRMHHEAAAAEEMITIVTGSPAEFCCLRCCLPISISCFQAASRSSFRLANAQST
jgi:hypothetical protein